MTYISRNLHTATLSKLPASDYRLEWAKYYFNRPKHPHAEQLSWWYLFLYESNKQS